MRRTIDIKRMLAAGGMTAVAALYVVPRAGTDANPINQAMAHVVPVVVTDTMKPRLTADLGNGWDLSILDNPLVDSWVERFTKGNMKSTLAIWLDRKVKYDGMISEKLAERNMPQDLVFLAMIESGFNPRAKSPAAAGGLWQFISETGRRYGLKVNGRVDERNQRTRQPMQRSRTCLICTIASVRGTSRQRRTTPARIASDASCAKRREASAERTRITIRSRTGCRRKHATTFRR